MLFQRDSHYHEGKKEKEIRMKKLFTFLCSMFPKSIQPPKDNLLNIVNQIASTSLYNPSNSTLTLPLAAPPASPALKFYGDNACGSSNNNNRTSRSVSRLSNRNKRRGSYFD